MYLTILKIPKYYFLGSFGTYGCLNDILEPSHGCSLCSCSEECMKLAHKYVIKPDVLILLVLTQTEDMKDIISDVPKNLGGPMKRSFAINICGEHVYIF